MSKVLIQIRHHMTSFRMILIGFLLLTLAGAFLLTLPAASQSGEKVPFINALFTSASAACVTGLVTYDTASQWTLFGRTVILLLIQTGGLGVVTIATLMMSASGRKIGLLQRMTMMDAINAPQIGGIVRFTKFFVFGTITAETVGTICLLPVFVPGNGFLKGLGYALFHSVSAFCNAGFDLMGGKGPFSSLTSFASNAWVNLVIMALIILGGIGFLTWSDLLENRFRIRRCRLQTKVILSTTAALITIPFLYFFFLEFTGYPLKERFLYSIFQSVTPRTAGFNTFNYEEMSESGLLITILLMLTGGAPGSTAGGFKVTTLAVLLLCANAGLHKKENVNCFGRRINMDIVHDAFSLVTVYITLLMAGSILIAKIENVPIITSMFECASALGTVGLTTGITPALSSISKIVLIFFMFFGRVGAMTLAYAMISITKKEVGRLPAEKISVG